jgi:hypothetical protein
VHCRLCRARAAHVCDLRIEIIPSARHFMFEDDPMQCCAAVQEFLAGLSPAALFNDRSRSIVLKNLGTSILATD